MRAFLSVGVFEVHEGKKGDVRVCTTVVFIHGINKQEIKKEIKNVGGWCGG